MLINGIDHRNESLNDQIKKIKPVSMLKITQNEKPTLAVFEKVYSKSNKIKQEQKKNDLKVKQTSESKKSLFKIIVFTHTALYTLLPVSVT